MMLKIKDNVDLKELEKFGFELRHYSWANNIYERPLMYPKYSKQSLYVDFDSREIDEEEIRFNVIDAKEEHIQDLIKAYLVEKVGE